MRIRTSTNAPVRALAACAALSLTLVAACAPETESEEGIVEEAPYEEPAAAKATDIGAPGVGVDEEPIVTDDMDATDAAVDGE